MSALSLNIPGVLDPDRAAAMAAALSDPRLVGESQLVGTFRGSRGFGVVFTAAGLPALRERFRALGPFLDVLELGDPVRALRPWPRLRRAPTLNAYYLNVLILDEGRAVGRHVDGTLQDPAGMAGITPEVVTVLYLAVPGRVSGGELVLFRGSIEAAVVEPEVGSLLHFRGDLAHEVRPLEGARGPRVSVICEQYALPDEAATRLPKLSLQSRAIGPVFAAGPRTGRPFAERLQR